MPQRPWCDRSGRAVATWMPPTIPPIPARLRRNRQPCRPRLRSNGLPQPGVQLASAANCDPNAAFNPARPCHAATVASAVVLPPARARPASAAFHQPTAPSRGAAEPFRRAGRRMGDPGRRLRQSGPGPHGGGGCPRARRQTSSAPPPWRCSRRRRSAARCSIALASLICRPAQRRAPARVSITANYPASSSRPTARDRSFLGQG